MTEDDKALVYELRKFRPDTTMCNEAADRIEALSLVNQELRSENEMLREALTQIARLRTDLPGDFSLGSKQSDIARAALGETK